MTKKDSFIEDNFDLEQYKKAFISERVTKKNKLARDMKKEKTVNFIISVIFIILGSLLYLLIAYFIENARL